MQILFEDRNNTKQVRTLRTNITSSLMALNVGRILLLRFGKSTQPRAQQGGYSRYIRIACHLPERIYMYVIHSKSTFSDFSLPKSTF